MSETISVELFCPECGYDLRGIESRHCPECGSEVERSRLGESRLPWRHRKRLGYFRALWRTIWLASFRPALLAREMNVPVSFIDAVKFRRVVCFIAWAPLAAMSVLPIWQALYTQFPGPWVSTDTLGSILQIAGIALLWLCLWLYLLASSGVPSYFFHPASLDVIHQNRAIALSYYTCAPLAFTPLTIVLGVAVFVLDPWGKRVPWYALTLAFLVFAVVAFIQLFLLARLPAQLLRLITQRERFWETGMSMLISLLRVLLAVAILVILPSIYIVISVAVLSLFP
jgi:hypothetical protein